MTQLYRHFDKSGRLLYVGISLSAIKRLKEHHGGSSWFNDITGVDIENFPTLEDALSAERKAIQTERPIFNIVHNGGPRRRKNEREITPSKRTARPSSPQSSPTEWPCNASFEKRWRTTSINEIRSLCSYKYGIKKSFDDNAHKDFDIKAAMEKIRSSNIDEDIKYVMMRIRHVVHQTNVLVTHGHEVWEDNVMTKYRDIMENI